MDLRWIIIIIVIIVGPIIIFSGANEFLMLIATTTLLFLLMWIFKFDARTILVVIIVGLLLSMSEFIWVAHLKFGQYSFDKSYFQVPLWIIPGWALVFVIGYLTINQSLNISKQ
jgi:hypothetical protein